MINSAPHEQAVELSIKRNLEDASYTLEIIEKTSIGHGLRRMCRDDRKHLEYKFHSAYYLTIKGRPFTDFPELLTLQEKTGIKNIGKAYLTKNGCKELTDYIVEVTKVFLKTDIANANYYACLIDGSTNSSVIEQKVVYLLFLCEDTPTVKYFRVESVKTADAAGIIESIEAEFNQLGVTSFTDRMSGLNVDGASVNVGVHRGVGTQLVLSHQPHGSKSFTVSNTELN